MCKIWALSGVSNLFITYFSKGTPARKITCMQNTGTFRRAQYFQKEPPYLAPIQTHLSQRCTKNNVSTTITIFICNMGISTNTYMFKNNVKPLHILGISTHADIGTYVIIGHLSRVMVRNISPKILA